MKSLSLIISNQDISIIFKAFLQCSSDIEMFYALENERESNLEAFGPLLIYIFDRYEHERLRYLFKFDNAKIEIEDNPEFERAYQQDQTLPGDDFRRYRLCKDIELFDRMVGDQELLFVREMHYRRAKELQQTLLRFRSSYVERYEKRQLRALEPTKSATVMDVTNTLLGEAPDKERLLVPVFLVAMDMKYPDQSLVAPTLREQWTGMANSLISEFLGSVPELTSSKFVARFIPMIPEHRMLSFRQGFRVMTMRLRQFRTLIQHLYKPDLWDVKFVEGLRVVSSSSESGSFFDLFLFGEKVVLRVGSFLHCLGFRDLNNWNLFFHAMWDVIGKDNSLFDACGHLEI